MTCRSVPLIVRHCDSCRTGCGQPSLVRALIGQRVHTAVSRPVSARLEQPAGRRLADRKPLEFPTGGSLLVAEINVKPAGPTIVSVTETVTVTGTSLLSGGHRTLGLAEQVMVGGVRSIVTVLLASALMLPALSTARRLTIVAPWPFRVTLARSEE